MVGGAFYAFWKATSESLSTLVSAVFVICDAVYVLFRTGLTLMLGADFKKWSNT
jgi:hypothetical protein